MLLLHSRTFYGKQKYMIRYINTLTLIAIALFLTTSCDSTETDIPTDEITTEEIAKANVDGEAYLDYLDLTDTLDKANSLYYSRQVGDDIEWTDVIMTLDDSSRILKMVERFLVSGTEAVCSNHFYFKDGNKYATKQFFLESEQDSSYFVELLSYYDEKGKVTATKRRTAVYEDFLPQEQYMVAEKKSCSEDRAFDIVNQTGEFETTYQGFVEMQGFKYLVVGEDEKDGFSSALIVQRTTPLILELRANEADMIGTSLVVNFRTITDGGSSQQILMGVAKKYDLVD